MVCVPRRQPRPVFRLPSVSPDRIPRGDEQDSAAAEVVTRFGFRSPPVPCGHVSKTLQKTEKDQMCCCTTHSLARLSQSNRPP